MTNRGILLVGAVTAAVLGGTSLASAQAYWDNPPGAIIQDRGYVQSRGYSAEAPGWWYGHRAYAYGPRVYLRSRELAPRRFYYEDEF